MQILKFSKVVKRIATGAGLGLLCALSLAAADPAAETSGGTYAVARTPWGHPDLQAMWVNDSATPLERPKAFAGRQTLSDEDFSNLQAKAAEVTDGGDAFFGDDFVKAAIAKGSEYRSFDQKTGNYNQFWISERSLENRTSLIIDPPDGQLPALTPAGRVRMADLGRKFAGHQPAGPEDLSPQVRCITYGVPYILAGYNSYFHFLQTPDHVVIYQEMIHDARIIPLDGRAHLPAQI